jgi:polysaccharide export outer membrane protein
MGRSFCEVRARSGGSPRGKSIARQLLVAGAIGLSLAGCVRRGGAVAYDVQNFGPPDAAATAVPMAQQRISALDKVSVRVVQVEDLSGQFQVDAEGNIQLPLVGLVPAAGKTSGELATEIERMLGTRYLQNPDVQVTITEFAQQQVTLEGAVREPGIVPIRGTTTLVRAIAMAHGLAEDANPARVVVFRNIGGQRMAAAFDLRSIRTSQAPDPDIYGNDVIVVEGMATRRFIRDIMSAIPAFGIFTPLLNN